VALSFANPMAVANPLQQGITAATYGRCMVDVLTPDRLQMAAALGALAPAAVNRVAAPPDEMGIIVQMCAHQLHQQRCSKQILAVAGDIYMAQFQNVNKVTPPSMNAGAVMGGTVGVLGGMLLGPSDGFGKVASMGVGGWAGAKAGSSLMGGGEAAVCQMKLTEMDAISNRLQGFIGSNYSAQALMTLIENNQRSQVITDQEAADLKGEIGRLSSQAANLFK